MSGSATLATDRFRLATPATRISAASTRPARSGASRGSLPEVPTSARTSHAPARAARHLIGMRHMVAPSAVMPSMPHARWCAGAVAVVASLAYTAARSLVERQSPRPLRSASRPSSPPATAGPRVRARGVPADKLTSADMKPQVSWPASSPWCARGRRDEPDARRRQHDRLPGRVGTTTAYPAPFTAAAGGGGGSSAFEPDLVAARPAVRELEQGMVPDVSAFADESPGYPIVCSSGVQGCKGAGPEHRLRHGGTRPPRRSSPG